MIYSALEPDLLGPFLKYLEKGGARQVVCQRDILDIISSHVRPAKAPPFQSKASGSELCQMIGKKLFSTNLFDSAYINRASLGLGESG